MLRQRDQRGFTLIELMIAVVIAGLLAGVVARLTMQGFRGWMYTYSGIFSQQNARIARNNILRNLRQAKASSVLINSFDSLQIPMSMVSFIDVNGNSLCYFQKGNRLYQGRWGYNQGVRLTSTASVLINGSAQSRYYLERFQVFYPNIKDPKNVNFVINTRWVVEANPNTTNALKPQLIQLQGDVQIRDP